MKRQSLHGCTGFALLLLWGVACQRQNELVAPLPQARLKITLQFNPRSPAKPSIARATRASTISPITRVTASVFETVPGDTVIQDQELSIVSENGQKFAEGQLLIPVEFDGQTILVQAFDGTRLFSKGEAEVTLSPGEVRETPLSITMLQFPSIFNVRQQPVALNDCDLGDGGALASSFQIDFDFADADGDVIAGSRVTVNFSFVGGNSGTFVASPNIAGSGAQGTISTGQCYRFDTTERLDVSMTLTDAGGLTSEPLTLVIDRPQGANRTVDGGPALGRAIGKVVQ